MRSGTQQYSQVCRITEWTGLEETSEIIKSNLFSGDPVQHRTDATLMGGFHTILKSVICSSEVLENKANFSLLPFPGQPSSFRNEGRMFGSWLFSHCSSIWPCSSQKSTSRNRDCNRGSGKQQCWQEFAQLGALILTEYHLWIIHQATFSFPFCGQTLKKPRDVADDL